MAQLTAADKGSDQDQGEKPKLATIKLDRDIYDKIVDHIDKGNRAEGGIRGFANDTLDMSINRFAYINPRLDPFLSLVTTEGNSVYIKDAKLNKVIEVQLRYDETGDRLRMECQAQEDASKSINCVHVAFCLALPELGKLDIVKFLIKYPPSHDTRIS